MAFSINEKLKFLGPYYKIQLSPFLYLLLHLISEIIPFLPEDRSSPCLESSNRAFTLPRLKVTLTAPFFFFFFFFVFFFFFLFTLTFSGLCHGLPRRTGFDLSSAHVRFVGDELALDKFLSHYFGFPLSVSFHQCWSLISNYMFLLPEGQTGEAAEPSK